MKKLLVILMVLAFVAPAMADDALDASGSMRVEAYSISNRNFTDDDEQDRDYWDQRFRLQLRMRPAEGVSATVRADLAENEWGELNDNRPGLAPDDEGRIGEGGANNIIMVDRAYLSIDKGLVNVTAGLNAWNLGNGHAYNNQGQAVQLTVKTPLVVRLGYGKLDENGGLDDTDEAGTEDTDTYFVDLGFKNDMMSINVFFGAITDGRDGDQNEPNVFGALYKGKIGPVNILAEIDIFGGDAADGGDLFGQIFFADVSYMLSDQVTLGSHLVYSAGTDDDDETHITNVRSNADTIYQDVILPQNGPGALQPLGASDFFDINQNAGNVFSSAGPGSGQGAIGLAPYVKFKVMDELTLAAHIAWLTAAEDHRNPAAEIDSVLYYGAGASWALAPKAKLDFGYTAATPEEGDDFVGEIEDYSAFGAVLSVSF